MNLVVWISFGAITAWIASIIIGRRSHTQSIAAGIVGAVTAGSAMHTIAGNPQNGIDYYSLIVSVAGSLLSVGLTIMVTAQEHNKR